MKNEKDPIQINTNVIEDAWLHLHGSIDESKMFNPLLLIPKDRLDVGIAWIFQRPEYFSFICKHVFNIELLPTQALMLKELWNRKFPMLIASRGFGKSFMLSLYSMMRALLMPGRKIVIVGAAFRQSKVLFEYMKTIWYNAPVLRSMVSQNSGPTASTDMCKMTINNSTVTCLPLGDGCLSLTTPITYKNKFGTFANIFQNQDCIRDEKHKVILWQGHNKTWSSSDYKHYNGSKDTIILTTRKGYKIEGTHNHKIRFNNDGKIEWRRLDSLVVGDKGVMIDRTERWHEGQEYDNVDAAYALGLMIGDGCWTNKYRLRYTTKDEELIKYLEDGTGYEFRICGDGIHYNHDSIEDAYDWKDGWGFEETYTKDKYIPDKIMGSSQEVMSAVLSGLYDSDGHVQVSTAKGGIGITVGFTNTSKKLVDQMQYVLLHYGIISYKTCRIREPDRWNPIYELLITGINVKKFAKQIGFKLNRKKYILENAISLKQKWLEYGQTKNKDKNIYVDEVCNIEFGHTNTFDIHVPDGNYYSAGGFVSHNTKIRGQRANDIITDEFAAVPEAIFETVVAGFAAVSSSPIENVKRVASHKKAVELGLETEEENVAYRPDENQIIICGTADYEFKHFGQYWKKWHKIIRSRGHKHKLQEIFGDHHVPEEFDWRHYSIMRIPYELLPKGFMDAASVARSKATVHSGIYQMEYGAVFSADSNGFFRRSLLERCTPSIDNQITVGGKNITFEPDIKGNVFGQYIYGVDPASEIDNFSITVLEMKEDHRRIVFCWTTTRREHKEKVAKGLVKETDFYSYCARKIRDLMKVFPCIHIALDKQGGGVAIMEALHDQDKIQKGEHPIWEVIDPDKAKDTDYFQGQHILELCQFANSEWTGDANHGMRFDFESQVLLFPSFDPVSLGLSQAMDEAAGTSIYDGLEDCVLEIEELKNELSIIEITQTASGRDKWDTPEYKTDTGKKLRLRKDRYSALLMANKAARDKQRAMPLPDMSSIGGFAGRLGFDEHPEGPLYSGPDWFKDVNGQIYN